MASPMGIGHSDHQVGLEKREVVVSPVPHDDIAAFWIRLGSFQNGPVVGTGIYYGSPYQMGLILFYLFDGAVVFLQVPQMDKALHPLLHQFAVRHRMTYRDASSEHL